MGGSSTALAVRRKHSSTTSSPSPLVGVASTLLDGGRTAHSTFQISIDLSETRTCYVHRESDRAHILRIADVISWDEAPIAHRNCHQAAERMLRGVSWSTTSCREGGMSVIGRDLRHRFCRSCGGKHGGKWSTPASITAPYRRLSACSASKRTCAPCARGGDNYALRDFCDRKVSIGNGTEEEIPSSEDAVSVHSPDKHCGATRRR